MQEKKPAKTTLDKIVGHNVTDPEPLTLDTMIKSGEQIVETYDVADSPLKIVGNKDKGYFLALGKYRISDGYQEHTFLENASIEEMMSIIFKMICTVVGDNEEERIKKNL